LFEQGLDFGLSGCLGQVSYINSDFHFLLLSPARPVIEMTASP
jgi:hypothetical protein